MSALAHETQEWLRASGFTVESPALWREALTHGSTDEAFSYERLEFLGDRVLGLAMAEWLYRLGHDAEGQLAQRLNVLVSKAHCAEVARALGAAEHIRLDRQAREDGAQHGDNLLGDITEALLGANFLEAGFEPTRTLIHTLWREQVEGAAGRAKHPKSALQEWAAGNRRKPPEYKLVDRSGPDHAARFTVEVSVLNVGSAQAVASSKQEAETRAAKAFMEQYG